MTNFFSVCLKCQNYTANSNLWQPCHARTIAWHYSMSYPHRCMTKMSCMLRCCVIKMSCTYRCMTKLSHVFNPIRIGVTFLSHILACATLLSCVYGSMIYACSVSFFYWGVQVQYRAAGRRVRDRLQTAVRYFSMGQLRLRVEVGRSSPTLAVLSFCLHSQTLCTILLITYG